MPITSAKIVKLLKEMEELYTDIYPLIEGLPFDGPRDPNESALPYFRRAAGICNSAEAFCKSLEEYLGERVREMRHCIHQVVIWDVEHEGLNAKEVEDYRKMLKGRNKQIREKIKKYSKATLTS